MICHWSLQRVSKLPLRKGAYLHAAPSQIVTPLTLKNGKRPVKYT